MVAPVDSSQQSIEAVALITDAPVIIITYRRRLPLLKPK